MLLFGYYQIVDGAFRPSDLSGDFYRLMIEPGSPPFTDADYIAAFWGPLGQLVTFSLLVAAGIVFRRRRELHKRLMVFSLMPMAGMPVAHLSGAWRIAQSVPTQPRGNTRLSARRPREVLLAGR